MTQKRTAGLRGNIYIIISRYLILPWYLSSRIAISVSLTPLIVHRPFPIPLQALDVPDTRRDLYVEAAQDLLHSDLDPMVFHKLASSENDLRHEEVNLLFPIRSDRDFWTLGDDCGDVSRAELTPDRILDPRD